MKLERQPFSKVSCRPNLLLRNFQSVLAYRIAHALWADGDEGAALLLQSRASELFAVDIHPTATLGAGVMLDHGTGVVIGSTAVVGDDVYMLHGVTLGATGKPVPRGSKRHPTLGRGCTVGANATVLGDIVVGDGATVAQRTSEGRDASTRFIGVAGRSFAICKRRSTASPRSNPEASSAAFVASVNASARTNRF